ncbi:MAG: DNA polymerase IV [Proteobacteria bacterium]|nr:DNA polymerase IV [Pseudomonadota bacterium]
MDAFYAAVEQRDNPSLRGLPVIVAGKAENRGVVSAASYEARVFGVHSAMPTSQAKRLCPEGIFLPVRMDRYHEVSEQILALLTEFTPLVESLSLDESYLDVTGSEKLFGPPLKIAQEIKRRIYETTGLTASAGIAPNKFLAKIASDFKKPDGLVEIKPGEVEEFLQELPISKLGGVGKSTAEVLQSLGIFKVGQLANYPPALIEKKLGNFGLELVTLSRGQDDRPVTPQAEPKSISQEETFTPDLHHLAGMKKALLEQSERVGWELRKQRLKGYTVQLKVRYPDFSLVTRRATLPSPTDQGMVIYQTAIKLLDKTEALKKRARLLGVGVSNLRRPDAPEQLSLFHSHQKKGERSIAAVDRIWEKFGPHAIQRASLIEKKDDEEMRG